MASSGNTRRERAMLEGLSHAAHGLCAPFACVGNESSDIADALRQAHRVIRMACPSSHNTPGNARMPLLASSQILRQVCCRYV